MTRGPAIPSSLAVWASRRRDDVWAQAEHVLQHSAITPQQARLLMTALEAGRAGTAAEEGLLPLIHLPLLVYWGLRGEDTPAIPLAAATTLLFLGLDVCDDLADGDLPAHWAGYRPAEIQLAAATLLAAIPQLAIAQFAAPPPTLAGMQETLAQGLLSMSAGQQQDLGSVGHVEIGVQAVEDSVIRKGGGDERIFASLAAQLAGAPAAVVARYAELGEALGTAGQLASDCADLFSAGHSKDLTNGTRTLPLALYLQRLDRPARDEFSQLLDGAQQDERMQEAVRERLRAAGVLRRMALVIDVYCERARQALAELQPQEPAQSGLRAMIERNALFR